MSMLRGCGAWRRAVAVAVLGVAAGCGREAPVPATGALRVELVLPSVEGPIPERGFTLTEARGAVAALRPVAKGERGPVYEAQGPAGSWTLGTPEGFRPIGGHTMDMTPGMPTITLGVGRPRTVYLQPPDRGEITQVAVLMVTPADPHVHVVAAERLGPGEDGRVGLRMPDVALGAPLRVHAVLARGTHATPVPTRPPKDGAPILHHLEPTPSNPFTVRFVAAPGMKAAVGEPVRLVSTLGTLESIETAPLEGDGAARFAQVPSEPEALRVLGAGVDVDVLEAGAGVAEAAVLALPDGAAGRVRLRIRGFDAAAGAPVVQVRPEGASSYGLLRSDALPGTAPEVVRGLHLPPGRYRVSARQGELVATSVVPFEVGPVEPADVLLVAERLATLSVSLEGGAPAGRRYDVEAKRLEGDAEVLGQGFCARNVGRPDLVLFLPPGRYRVRLIENGREGPVKELSLDIPGVRGQVRLSPPR